MRRLLGGSNLEKGRRSQWSISHVAQKIAHHKALFAPHRILDSKLFRNCFSASADRERFPALATTADMIFQGPSASRCKDFRGQAAVVRTESALCRCPTNGASARRWALCLGHELESLSALRPHKKSQPNRTLADASVPEENPDA